MKLLSKLHISPILIIIVIIIIIIMASSHGGVKNFHSFMSSIPAMGSTQPPIQTESVAFCQGVKRPGPEAGHSPPTSGEVKNTWIYTLLPHTP
jgi:amino acid transporter